MFDRFRCLIPTRRNWHRTLMIYMLFMSCGGMMSWGVCWGFLPNTRPLTSLYPSSSLVSPTLSAARQPVLRAQAADR